MARLECQRRNTRLRTWTDHDAIWRFAGQLDPITGVRVAARLDAAGHNTGPPNHRAV